MAESSHRTEHGLGKFSQLKISGTARAAQSHLVEDQQLASLLNKSVQDSSPQADRSAKDATIASSSLKSGEAMKLFSRGESFIIDND